MAESDLERRQFLKLTVAAMLAATIAACSTVHKDFKPASLAPTAQQQIPGKTVVVVPDALCSLYYDNGNLTEFELGPVVCLNVRHAAQLALPGARFYRSADDIRPGEADFIGSVQPRRVLTAFDNREIPARVFAYVNVTWQFRALDGARQYRATIFGDGLDVRTFGRADIRYATSMQRCMDDLAKNLYQEMTAAYAKAGKNVEVTHRLRSVIGQYRPGITTYAQYRADRTTDWHIYALDERVKLGNSGFGYLIDPESDRHESYMGDWNLLGMPAVIPPEHMRNQATRLITQWVTHWGRRQPVIESLRPTVYMPESKVDRSKIDKVYIKEIVGSVYDNHPLCELVFEGGNFDAVVLKQQSCQKDYSGMDAYASRDIYHEHQLSEIAQQWLKLRIGMTRDEAIALIGYPPRQVYDAGFQVSTFEYRHGQVRFGSEKGLVFWQLY